MRLVSELVRARRERLAISIEDICKRSGVSTHTWVKAEHGGDLRPSSIRRIADALGVEPGELLEDPKAGVPSEPGRSEAVADLGEWRETFKLELIIEELATSGKLDELSDRDIRAVAREFEDALWRAVDERRGESA